MLPENYNYSSNDPRGNTCSDCLHRCVAFHLMAGTSYCDLHNCRIGSTTFCSCGDWVQDTREKITWTQNVVKAMKMPKAECYSFITSFSLSGHCPTCKNCERSLDFYYCKKYFDELEGIERTCKLCQVDLFGKCSFYDEK